MDPLTFISEFLKNPSPEQKGIFSIIWNVFATWWWVIMPLILFGPMKFFYKFWIMKRWDETQDKIVIEVKVPKEILKPIKAMEYVMSGLHGIHDVPNFRERWIEGQFQLAISFEIVGVDGQPHFFIRLPAKFRRLVESNIYAQYPEAEISQVEDYTIKIPQDIPNKDWNLWGMDLKLSKEDFYPIKTYNKFELEKEAKEEKRVDPLANLLESMTTLKQGEQMWLQIIAKPFIGEPIGGKIWIEEGRKLVDKLVRRPAVITPRPIVQEAAEILIFGPQTTTLPEFREIIPPEMKLTPGERDIVTAIEEKLGKFGFISNIRFIYLAKQEIFNPAAPIRMAMGFFRSISTQNLNGLRPIVETLTKIQWILRTRRVWLRKRRMFRYYQKRWMPFFPRQGGTYVLNVEELATLYHFPSKMVAPAPTFERVEAKRREPPTQLPVE